MNNTLVLITFDVNDTSTQQNRILGILLGDAVPAELVGAMDDTFYNHYSELSTVQANWALHTLGRWDVGANVFKFVAEKTGDKVRPWAGKVPLSQMFFNVSYAGKLKRRRWHRSAPLPVPNVDLVHNGRTVLQAVQDTRANYQSRSVYTTAFEVPDGLHPEAEFD
jgi:acid phosphatase